MLHILNYCHICKDVVSGSPTTYDAPRAVVDHARTVHPRSKMARDPRIENGWPASRAILVGTRDPRRPHATAAESGEPAASASAVPVETGGHEIGQGAAVESARGE